MRSGWSRKRDCRQEQAIEPLVGAGGLDVTGLLALVACEERIRELRKRVDRLLPYRHGRG
jgi:hypothetical protein